VNDELEKWQYLAIADIKVLYLEGVKKTVKNLTQYSWCFSQDLNHAPAKYK
jgi:hypothetical protein